MDYCSLAGALSHTASITSSKHFIYLRNTGRKGNQYWFQVGKKSDCNWTIPLKDNTVPEIYFKRLHSKNHARIYNRRTDQRQAGPRYLPIENTANLRATYWQTLDNQWSTGEPPQTPATDFGQWPNSNNTLQTTPHNKLDTIEVPPFHLDWTSNDPVHLRKSIYTGWKKTCR